MCQYLHCDSGLKTSVPVLQLRKCVHSLSLNAPEGVQHHEHKTRSSCSSKWWDPETSTRTTQTISLLIPAIHAWTHTRMNFVLWSFSFRSFNHIDNSKILHGKLRKLYCEKSTIHCHFTPSPLCHQNMYHCWTHSCLTFASLLSSHNRCFSSPSRPPCLFKSHVLFTATEFCLALFLQVSSHSLKRPQFSPFACYPSCLLCSFQCPTQTTSSLNISPLLSSCHLSPCSHHLQSCILLFPNH